MPTKADGSIPKIAVELLNRQSRIRAFRPIGPIIHGISIDKRQGLPTTAHPHEKCRKLKRWCTGFTDRPALMIQQIVPPVHAMIKKREILRGIGGDCRVCHDAPPSWSSRRRSVAAHCRNAKLKQSPTKICAKQNFYCLDNSCLDDYKEGMNSVMDDKTKETSRKFDSLEQEAYLAIWRTFDRLRVFDEALFAQWGLTAQQYNVLRILRAASPEAVPTLSLVTRLVSRAPDITRMLDRLEESGWISRSRSTTDRRAVLVAITENGIALLDRLIAPLKACHAKQLEHLSQSELQQLCQLLRKARMPHEPSDSPWC
jgi:DNA-binding MarR family transcriptional regulator